MHHPFLLPGLCRDLLQFSSGFESVSYFGSKKHRQGSNRKQEFRMFGWLPMLAVSGQATRTDQEVGMGMIEHGPGPSMKHAQQAGLCAQPLRISAELLDAGRRRRKQHTVEHRLPRTRQPARAGTEAERRQII